MSKAARSAERSRPLPSRSKRSDVIVNLTADLVDPHQGARGPHNPRHPFRVRAGPEPGASEVTPGGVEGLRTALVTQREPVTRTECTASDRGVEVTEASK
jgi:hypothetical protein